MFCFVFPLRVCVHSGSNPCVFRCSDALASALRVTEDIHGLQVEGLALTTDTLSVTREMRALLDETKEETRRLALATAAITSEIDR